MNIHKIREYLFVILHKVKKALKIRRLRPKGRNCTAKYRHIWDVEAPRLRMNIPADPYASQDTEPTGQKVLKLCT